MAKRETAASQSMPRSSGKKSARGKVTKQFVDAGRENLAKAREAAKQKGKEARDAGIPVGAERWAMLIDGRLSVSDLDDEEIRHARTFNENMGFTGNRRALPSHLAQQFQSEAIKRANDQFRIFMPDAVRRLIEIAEDPDVKPEVQVRALQLAMERGLGKTPETIRIEGANVFDTVTMEALGMDRELAGESDRASSKDGE